jgi:hypothetical protein
MYRLLRSLCKDIDALDSLQRASNVSVFSYVRHYQYMIVFSPKSPHVQDPVVRRAAGYLESQQHADGTWYGRWGCNYIYGSFLGLRGLLHAGEDVGVIVVLATSGEAGQIADPSLATPENLGGVREGEDVASWREVGVPVEHHFLRFPDGGVGVREQTPGSRVVGPDRHRSLGQQAIQVGHGGAADETLITAVFFRHYIHMPGAGDLRKCGHAGKQRQHNNQLSCNGCDL